MCLCFENWINGLGKWANQLYYVNNRDNGNTRFLPNSAISFRDWHFLIDFMLLFCLIWQKGQENQITKQLLRQIHTGLDFSENFWINREAVSDSQTNVKTIRQWMGIFLGWEFVFLTQKEPVHKSHLLMKPTTLGALRARATIVRSLRKYFYLIFLPLFSATLSSPQLKSSTWNTAYINILFCDNSGVAQLFLRVAVARHPGRSAPGSL